MSGRRRAEGPVSDCRCQHGPRPAQRAAAGAGGRASLGPCVSLRALGPRVDASEANPAPGTPSGPQGAWADPGPWERRAGRGGALGRGRPCFGSGRASATGERVVSSPRPDLSPLFFPCAGAGDFPRTPEAWPR